MKTLVRHFLNPSRLVAILIVAFVLASAVVGYTSQLSSSGPSLGGYGVVNGPVGIVNGTAVPGLMQQVTFSATTTASEASPAETYSTSFGGRMIELDGYLTIQVDDVKAASDRAAMLASSLGGYVASSSFDDSGPSASIVLRIPEANFSSAMHGVSALGVVKAQSISSNDVTEQYVNLQAQLDSYTTEEATLLRILNSSTTVNDALNTENAIQNTQAEINDLEGQLLVMHRLVAFATINLELTQPVQPPKPPTLDFSDAFNSALLAFYTVTKGMLILGASLTPVAFVAGIVYVPYRHLSRKKPQPTEAK
jgi:hypothetical protein